MKTKFNVTLWGGFVITVFLIMSFSAFTTTGILVMADRHGLISFGKYNPSVPIISFLFTSVLVGTVVSTLVGHKLMKPMMELVEAVKEIARGNFDVRMKESKGLREVREMLHSFNIMAQELSGIETLRNDFVVNVSHEFKTPIASIEGYATLLQSGSLTEEDRNEYTKLIIQSAQKLSTLTSNILRLSKLETQGIIPSKTRFFLDEQLRQALLMIETQWSRKNIELDIELMPVCFYGSEELLLQVWLNLLSNAIKFTPQNGTVLVHLVEKDGNVIVTVSDTGIGIAPEAQKHIFEKFYQGDRTRAEEGNGLGLALVKRIVTLCNGTVSVKSDLGEGSCFNVTLPNDTKAI